MTYSIHEIENFAVPLPIAQDSLRMAERFAAEQPTRDKADRVRRNTLAVCTVRDYLQLMGIQTNAAASDSWNSLVRLFSDVSDLELPGVGRLECRPIVKGDAICHIPPEVWADRLGYVVVELDEAAREAAIVGFTRAAVEQLPLNQLQPPETLLDAIAPLPESLVNLSGWFQNQFEAGWEVVSLLLPSSLSPAFRNRPSDSPQSSTAVRRGRILDLGIQAAERSLALLIEIQPEADQQAILLQVVPVDSTYLPPDVELTVLDETGAEYLQARSRQADNYIQLQFSGTVGELFSVRVVLNAASVTERFVI